MEMSSQLHPGRRLVGWQTSGPGSRQRTNRETRSTQRENHNDESSRTLRFWAGSLLSSNILRKTMKSKACGGESAQYVGGTWFLALVGQMRAGSPRKTLTT